MSIARDMALAPSILACALLAAGCASDPILTYASPAPAQVLAPARSAGIEDGRARFRVIFCERFAALGAPQGGATACSDYLHALADEPAPVPAPARTGVSLASVRFVLVPGFLGGAAPGDARTLGVSIERLARRGYRIERLPVSGGGSGAYNAATIAEYFRARVFSDDEKLVVIGHSKGVIDLMHFIVGYPDLAQRVDAMVSLSGAVNGSPLAEFYAELLVDVTVALTGVEAGDGAGYRSLKPSVQIPWLASHPLPRRIRYFSIASFTSRENVSAGLVEGYDRLAQINAKNDGQLIFYDQILPGSTLLGFLNGDHWAVAMPFTEKAPTFAATIATRNVFPREAMLEAVLQFVRENL